MDKQQILLCNVHKEGNNQIQFLCLNEETPNNMQRRLLCNYCLEDLNETNLIIVSLDRIQMNNRTVKSWPPLNQNYAQSLFNLSDINASYIEEFYENLKISVCELIEKQKKQDLLKLNSCNNESVLNNYNQISGFKEIQQIINENCNSVNDLNLKLNEYIQSMYNQKEQNQKIFDEKFQNLTVTKPEKLNQIKDNILEQFQSIEILQKQQNLIIQMVQSTYEKSSKFIITNSNKSILINPNKHTGQVYSQEPIFNDKIYQFILKFNKKPQNYICVGFEEEQHKNRYLGQQGRNSFIFGQINGLFCNQLVKGSTNLQNIVNDQFIEQLIIEVQLSENKFYISDLPKKSAVNCMDQGQYKFDIQKKYYFTIQISNQDTQIEIISSKIIPNFTLV
ncbi:ubiquitin family protein (macronuclear) [Tetrahymena thermophila SB210]|uniref:Ubiquitin family protein n=1 Tax=Tetrahymena thermophila (strain SB210) TaxID=312017 RepID=I7M7I1_TETTS|nr:ubiquitin family protein [Tetrahymena thermophila SB210]EAR93770.2 ubiquitin family protein [Tetrahymena thermophila SB210]|eukprot:XP_001014015.2 ubiquitin family protein [Tetrahymena thermophila SB210]